MILCLFSRKPESHLPDHEMFAISLETLLSTHFMYGDPDFSSRCVPSARSSILLGETIDDFRRHKKYSGYVVYVAYRLEPRSSISHAMKLSRVSIICGILWYIIDSTFRREYFIFMFLMKKFRQMCI